MEHLLEVEKGNIFHAVQMYPSKVVNVVFPLNSKN